MVRSMSVATRAAPLPPAQRRAAIISAVMPLLVQHGDGVTTKQIAGAAGVSEGTVFNVFVDKDELISAAVETALDPASFESAIAGIDPSLPFEARLVVATGLLQRRIVDVWRLISSVGPQHHRTKGGPIPDSPSLAALLASDEGEIRLEPVEAARLLRSLTLALTHPHLVATPKPAVEIVDVFLRGAGT
jgi:AcrR family transcriptional regulator